MLRTNDFGDVLSDPASVYILCFQCRVDPSKNVRKSTRRTVKPNTGHGDMKDTLTAITASAAHVSIGAVGTGAVYNNYNNNYQIIHHPENQQFATKLMGTCLDVVVWAVITGIDFSCADELSGAIPVEVWRNFIRDKLKAGFVGRSDLLSEIRAFIAFIAPPPQSIGDGMAGVEVVMSVLQEVSVFC